MRESTRIMAGTVFIFQFVTELVSALIYMILYLFEIFTLHAGKDAVIRKTAGWLLSLTGFILLATWLPLLTYGIRTSSSADADSHSNNLSVFLYNLIAAVLLRINAILTGKWSLLTAKVQHHLPVIVVIVAVVITLIWVTRREGWRLQGYLKNQAIAATSGADCPWRLDFHGHCHL